MTHQTLTPFARKLAETMCRVEPKWWGIGSAHGPAKGKPWPVTQDHGWSQREMQAILDRPHVVGP